LVLGVDWLRTLGPVLWDFFFMTMQYTHQGITTLLTGLNPTGWSLEGGSRFLKPSPSSNKGLLLKLLSVEIELNTHTPPRAIQALLHDFQQNHLAYPLFGDMIIKFPYAAHSLLMFVHIGIHISRRRK
jgi:hypothetical protein